MTATYALLIYRLRAETKGALDREEGASLAGHRSLQAEASSKDELHAVARLESTSTAKTVRKRASSHDVTDGPFIETKEWLVGFYLVDCETEAQAIERAKVICRDDAHAIEVRPVNWRGPA